MPDDQKNGAPERAAFPVQASRILNARTLSADYPYLAAQLRPGQSVLDVGCGTGAITAGIAQAVSPGRVVGADTNSALLAQATERHGHLPNLSFEQRDLYDLEGVGTFDVVVAARVLQWLDRPAQAASQLVAALRPGGRLFLLDYNHLNAELHPPPPPSMQHFRARYLAWRSDAGMDNEVADHLAGLLRRAGLQDVQVVTQHERTQRGEADFERRISLWGEVAATRGHQVVAAGYVSEAERRAAVEDFRHWARHEALTQTLYLLSAAATRPA